MEKSELIRLLPKNSNDVEGAKNIVRLGYPTVGPVLKSLFGWLETNGSEVEKVLRPFFAELGEPAFELVSEALDANIKPARKHAIMKYVLPHWPRELIVRLEEQLVRQLDKYDFYGLDVYALRLLIDKKVGDETHMESWQQLKLKRLKELALVLESGESPNTALKSDLGDAARPSAP